VVGKGLGILSGLTLGPTKRPNPKHFRQKENGVLHKKFCKHLVNEY